MITKEKQNPFNTDDLIINYFELDKDFLETRKQSFLKLKKEFNKPHQNIFMSLKQQYINFAHLITKNAIAATFIMLIALTTVGASAAELFAPEEYKPSILFARNFSDSNEDDKSDKASEENKQVTNFEECVATGAPVAESSPRQCSYNGQIFVEKLSPKDQNSLDNLSQVEALVADENHEVVTNEQCDLTIKFPKTSEALGEDSQNNEFLVRSKSEGEPEFSIEPSLNFGIGFDIPFGYGFVGQKFKCYDQEISFEDFTNITFEDTLGNTGQKFIFDEEDAGEFFEGEFDQTEEISRKELCQSIGLLEASCELIENPHLIREFNFEIGMIDNYFFQAGGKTYYVTFGSESNQIQFSSVLN